MDGVKNASEPEIKTHIEGPEQAPPFPVQHGAVRLDLTATAE
jgi:hypothetical protein